MDEDDDNRTIERPAPTHMVRPDQETLELEETGKAPVLVLTGPENQHIGKTLDGRYLLEAIIGEGGMGVVYRGRHKVIGKQVAVKVLRGEMARDKEMTERFLQEAKAASSIGNPHIVDISDFGSLPDGSTYFVMEYLKGVGLGDLMQQGRPVPVARLVHIARQIAQGLAAAHTAGIVHRDLKPDNVILIDRGSDKDFVKIVDFGIAKVGGESAQRITRAGSVFGTPHYMSPEQAAGAPVDHRTDVYALGIMLYEMAAGKVPFDADNFMGILTQHMYKAPVPIRALVPQPQPDMPPGLDAIILKCLSKKTEGRYANMEELVADFDRLQAGALPKAVDEMMARSGGFSVPGDYFRTPAMPFAVPGMPPREPKPRWPFYAAIGAGVSVVGAGLLAAIVSITSTSAHPIEVAPPPKAVEPAAVRPAVAETPARLILLAVEPRDAKLSRDGKDLGTQPVAITMKEGEPAVDVLVARAGYVSQTVKIDGRDPKPFVKLAPIPGKTPPRAPTPPPKPKGLDDGFKDPFLR